MAEALPEPTMSVDTSRNLAPTALVEEVDAWVSQHGTARSAAFAAIAERTGRTTSAVSQSYYAARRRAGRAPTSGGRRGRRAATSPSPRLSARPATAIKSLTEHIAALERELEELRAFRARVMALIGEG